MKVKTEFIPAKCRTGRSTQVFPVFGPPYFSLPGVGSVTLLDSQPARTEACLFPVPRSHALDACCFVEQTSSLSWAWPTHVGFHGGHCPWPGQRQPCPCPASERGAHTAAWSGALCFPPLQTLPTASSLQPPGLLRLLPPQFRPNLLKHAPSVSPSSWPPPTFPTPPWGCSVECRHPFWPRPFPTR